VRKFPTTYRRAGKFEEGIGFRGEKWVVGEQGKTSASPKTVKRLAELAGLFALEVKRRSGSSSNRVITTLPLETRIVDRKTGGRLEAVLRESLKDAGFELEKVYPQGVLALEALLADGVAKKENTLLIDGGFNTVNVLFVDEKLKPRLYLSYYDRGIKRLLELFKEELQASGRGHALSQAQLQEVFLTGELDEGLEITPVEREKEEAVNRYARELLDEIVELLKEKGLPFRQVAVVGGLSYYLKELKSVFKGKSVIIPETGGEYLNLKGLLLKDRNGEFLPFDLGFGWIKYWEGSGEDGEAQLRK